MKLLWFLSCSYLVVRVVCGVKYVSFLDHLTRYSLNEHLSFRQTADEYNAPTFNNPKDGTFEALDIFGKKYDLFYPHVRVDFGVTGDPLPNYDAEPNLNITFGAFTQHIINKLFFTPWNEFHVILMMNSGNAVSSKNMVYYGMELHDTNFPCNGNDEIETKSWMFNGRQIMFTVYYDDTSDDTMYVFVNVNDDICEYHIKITDFKSGTDLEPVKVPFKRFRGPHLEAPSGYKIVQPLMSVDSAARTLNYVVVSLSGPVQVKLMSYRFYSQGPDKPLTYELYDSTRDLLYSHKYDKFHGSAGGDKEVDYHSLDFLRDYNFRADFGSCEGHSNGLLSSYNCIHFLDVFYKDNEVYAMMGRPARKHSCIPAPGTGDVDRSAMFLEAGHCKYRPGIQRPLQKKSKS